MRFLLTLLCCGLFTAPLLAQTGIGNTSPDRSAALDVSATDKGFLVPRVTPAQRAAIKEPARGLIVFQIGEKEGFYYNNGTPLAPEWVVLIGDSLPQTLTNKTITSQTNDVTANRLRTTVADVSISNAAPPQPGQVLTANSATEAVWQYLSAVKSAYLYAYTQKQQTIGAGANVAFEAVPVSHLLTYDNATQSAVTPIDGDYKITYTLNIATSTIVAFIYVNGSPVQGSEFSAASNNREVVTGQLLVHLKAGDHVALTNGPSTQMCLFSSTTPAITLASLLIEKIN